MTNLKRGRNPVREGSALHLAPQRWGTHIFDGTRTFLGWASERQARISRLRSRCQERYIEAGGNDQRSAENHPGGGDFMPDEEGHNGASDQLGVVILRDIGRGGVA